MRKEILKQRRKELGLTQTQVGERVGVTSQAIFNYESGKRKISDEMLLKLSKVLNISADEILSCFDEK